MTDLRPFNDSVQNLHRVDIDKYFKLYKNAVVGTEQAGIDLIQYHKRIMYEDLQYLFDIDPLEAEHFSTMLFNYGYITPNARPIDFTDRDSAQNLADYSWRNFTGSYNLYQIKLLVELLKLQGISSRSFVSD